jgi:hypothetical protein
MKNKAKFVSMMFLCFFGYALGLTALNLFYDKNSEYRYLLVLLPMLPTLYIIPVTLRAVSEADELQKRIMLEALAFSGLATAFTCQGYSFLRDMGAPEFKAWVAWSLFFTYYFLGLALAKRRYR